MIGKSIQQSNDDRHWKQTKRECGVRLSHCEKTDQRKKKMRWRRLYLNGCKTTGTAGRKPLSSFDEESRDVWYTHTYTHLKREKTRKMAAQSNRKKAKSVSSYSSYWTGKWQTAAVLQLTFAQRSQAVCKLQNGSQPFLSQHPHNRTPPPAASRLQHQLFIFSIALTTSVKTTNGDRCT